MPSRKRNVRLRNFKALICVLNPKNSVHTLSFAIDADYSVAGLMRCRHKNGLSANAVHVDAHARLAVVQMNVTVLGDQVGYTVLVTYLKSVKNIIIINKERSIQKLHFQWIFTRLSVSKFIKS